MHPLGGARGSARNCVHSAARARKGLLRGVRYSNGHQPKHLYARLADGELEVTETRRDAAEADTLTNADSQD